jgi:hypothetical protein
MGNKKGPPKNSLNSEKKESEKKKIHTKIILNFPA